MISVFLQEYGKAKGQKMGRRMEKRRKRKSYFLKLSGILVLFVIVAAGGCFIFLNSPEEEPAAVSETPWEKASRTVKYPGDIPVIAEKENPDYEGTGQETVNDEEEYFSTFTTTEGRTYTEYKQNGITPWAQNEYWYETMEKSGCGITALSVILSGYGIERTPEELRVQYEPYMDYETLQEELINTFDIDASRFYYDDINLSEEEIQEHLMTGSPVLVCVWNEPACMGEETDENNRWTTESHFMVLLAADGQGKVYVSNPNGLMNKGNSSGWYDIDEITPYLAKVMYIY